jgi:hypothetical protein
MLSRMFFLGAYLLFFGTTCANASKKIQNIEESEQKKSIKANKEESSSIYDFGDLTLDLNLIFENLKFEEFIFEELAKGKIQKKSMGIDLTSSYDREEMINNNDKPRKMKEKKRQISQKKKDEGHN